jgi:phospholipase C
LSSSTRDKKSPRSEPTPPSRFSRRDALKAGLGLGALATAAGACGQMANRCAGGPEAPVDGAGGAAALRAIDTIVVLMLENRSLDNFLGGLSMDPTYPAAAALDGLRGDEVLRNENGAPMSLIRMTDNGTIDPKHNWEDSLTAFNGGRNDRFLLANPGPGQNEVLSFYGPDRIPFIHALAREFTICDRWFSSFMGPTWPNRFYLTSTTSVGLKKNLPMGLAPPPTIWERMAEGCWSAKNYYSSVLPWYSIAYPAKSFSGQDAIVPETLDHFYLDAAAGNLPNLAIIDPDFEANDGHAPHDLALCEAFVASVYRALAESPQWSRSLFVLVFDEHGGFFDHVPPPETDDPDPDFRRLGFRVPAIVAGPTVKRGAVVSTTFEHVSIAATLKSRFGIPSLGRRMNAANDLSSCLDPGATPRPAPALPTVALSSSGILRAPLRATSQPEMHALAAAGGVPHGHCDPRSGEERVRCWLRSAQELESVRVIA